MATNLAWTTSARTRPLERSIHSVILSAKASATLERSAGSSVISDPRARAATARATVLWSTPTSWPAARYDLVRSKASSTSISFSLGNMLWFLLGSMGSAVSAHRCQGGTQRWWIPLGRSLSVRGEKWWPSAGSFSVRLWGVSRGRRHGHGDDAAPPPGLGRARHRHPCRRGARHAPP